MIFFYIVFIFVISPLCLHLPDRIPTADSSENYSGQAGVLHFDNFYFPSENNTTVNINSMKSNVATFYPRSHERNDGETAIKSDGLERFNPRSHEGNDPCKAER